MPASYNIVADAGDWIVKDRFSSRVVKREPTKADAIAWARRNLAVGSRVYVYYASRSGLENEFTIRGQ